MKDAQKSIIKFTARLFVCVLVAMVSASLALQFFTSHSAVFLCGAGCTMLCGIACDLADFIVDSSLD